MALPNLLVHGLYTLNSPSHLNVIVGRNGAGKSQFLRNFSSLRNGDLHFVRYVSPERAGTFQYDPNLEANEINNRDWIESQRIKNQATGFKGGSANKLRDLAMRFSERMEKDLDLRADFKKTFVSVQLAKINSLLTNVSIEREGGGFAFKTIVGTTVPVDGLSSGESEVVALATEILHFFELCSLGKTNLLLLDEPDVHLHPDLQARFARFLVHELDALRPEVKASTLVCVATHSTPLICELSRSRDCSIGTKEFEKSVVNQSPISEQLKRVAPFFGHPLSLSISADVPVMLEGEDDERVWQQAARTGQGRLKIFPCVATSVEQLTELETFVDGLMRAVYDEPSAISVRDGDGIRGQLGERGCVKRFKLQCYAVENLLLTDEVLASLGATWLDLVRLGAAWCNANTAHRDHDELLELLQSQDRGRDQKIKNVRQLIPAILGSLKPWEFIVGQVIGRIGTDTVQNSANGIVDFVGRDCLLAVGLIE